MPQGTSPGALTAAAEALERELERYESLVRALERERLDSEKTLRRAGQALHGLQDCEERLRGYVANLGGALSEARHRQEALAATVVERSEQIARQTGKLKTLLDRWAALGQQAAEVSQVISRASPGAESNGGTAAPEPQVAYEQVDQLLGRLADDAEALGRSAASDGFSDLARQAQELRQQVLASRNKVRLARTT